jgi:hypothetical protein
MSRHDSSGLDDHSELDARLDAAFRALPDTDDLRDLRDELRASLADRVSELEASGFGPVGAIDRALAELGDIEALAAEVTGQPVTRGTVGAGGLEGGVREAASQPDAAARARDLIELMRRHRVRPRPAFVVRTVVLAVIAAVGLALTVLTACGILAWPQWASTVTAIVLLAIPVGVLVGDGAHQETTTNYPVPAGRAASYGSASFLAVAGLAMAGQFVGELDQVWLIAVGAPLVVVAVAWFSYLGATQTNRKKPWARQLASRYQGTDRFSQDEAAAARFGIYTAVIFVVAIAVFLVLSFTVGFVWSWLALVAGFVVFFLMLARMLFPSDSVKNRR